MDCTGVPPGARLVEASAFAGEASLRENLNPQNPED